MANYLELKFIHYDNNYVLGDVILPTEDKTKDQLLKELSDLRKENAELKLKLLQKENEKPYICKQIGSVTNRKDKNSLFFNDIQDISKGKQAEDALQDQVHFLQTLIDTIPNPIYYKDAQGLFQGCNKDFEKEMGFSKEEILGKSSYDIRTKELADIYTEKDLHLLNTPGVQVHETVIPFLDGTLHDVVLHKGTYKDRNGELSGLVGVVVDITKRKQVELALKKSEALYRTIFENTGTATTICEKDTTIALVNTEFELLSGYSKKEIEGKMSWQDFIITEDKKEMLEYYDMNIDNPDRNSKKYEIRFVDRNGTIKNVLITVATISNTQTHVASLLDITEIKRFQQEMIRLEQLNLVGQMAAGIGHEVRNPMTTVRGFLQMFKEKKDLTYIKYIDLMIEELDRANSIITQFLSLAKDKPLKKKKQNLNTIVEALFPLIQADAFKSNMLTNLVLEETPDLLIDDKEIRQVILNFARNGFEVMTEGNMLTIKTFVEADEAVLAVIDQGGGIEPEILNKLGTPFLTTKEQGTGLGLAVCYSIAARHNATIDISTSSKGSTFFMRFKLPIDSRSS